MTYRRSLTAIAATAFAALVTFTAGSARASFLPACGNVDVSSTASCTVDPPDCMAQCTPVAFEASCSASLEVGCMGGCNVSVDASCNTSCEASCNTSCTAGSFDCQGSCEAQAMGTCTSQCASSDDMTTCTAQCQASVSARCNVSCTASPPTCTGGCQAACQGSCSASANASCDISCQAKGFVSCQSMLTGGCSASCSSGGALVCNGQFVNVNQSQLSACENQIAMLLPNVTVTGEASASCSNGECDAQAKGSVSCGVTPGYTPFSAGFAFIGVGLALGVAARRRRA